MAIDLLELEKRFIDLLENTTQKEFEQWLLSKTKKPMAQQTAVEWFIDESLKLQVKYLHSDLTSIAYNDLKEQLKDKAKEMEKQQTIKFANDYIDDDDIRDLTAEEYYNETYTTRLQNETN